MNNGVSNNKVYVVGHKNPDTDSICSAIAYADLKSKITGEDYSPRRAGQLNEETQYVLDHFQVEAPKLLSDLRVQVKDVELRNIEGIKGSVSIKSAWKSMKELNIKTLPVTWDSKLEGLITIGDIATSYIAVWISCNDGSINGRCNIPVLRPCLGENPAVIHIHVRSRDISNGNQTFQFAGSFSG